MPTSINTSPSGALTRTSFAGTNPSGTQDLKIQEDKEDKQVSICCSHSSVYGLKYLSRLIISSSVLIFSFFEIATSEEGTDNSIYFSLMSSILGYYLSVAENTYNKKK